MFVLWIFRKIYKVRVTRWHLQISLCPSNSLKPKPRNLVQTFIFPCGRTVINDNQLFMLLHRQFKIKYANSLVYDRIATKLMRFPHTDLAWYTWQMLYLLNISILTLSLWVCYCKHLASSTVVSKEQPHNAASMAVNFQSCQYSSITKIVAD